MEDINHIKARNFLLATAPIFLQENFNEWIDDFNDLIETERVLYAKLFIYYKRLEHSVKDEAAKEKLWLSLNCVTFNELYQMIIVKFYEEFAEEDEYFFEKSKLLADMNVTAEQFGGNENHAIHFTAAVVELASLDSHKSPIEKFNCLSNTYDCIFAELKSVLIDVISKYSEKDTEIPIINDSEIKPVLMVVLIKSKPVHLISNLRYIEQFLWNHQENSHVKYILDQFKMAVEALRDATEETMQPASGEVCRCLDLKGIMEITAPQIRGRRIVSVLKEQRDRIGDLIVSATNEVNRKFK